jgi:hypothetical protein
MIDSLAHDADLVVNNRDVARWNLYKFENVPVGAYIQIGEKGIMKYAKPVLFPLIAAPFFCFGIMGLAVMNGLFLGGSIVLAYLFLRRDFLRKDALILALLFFFGSFMPVYATWVTPETLFYFACSLCVWLWRAKDNTALAALIIGAVASAKEVFLLLLIPLIMVLACEKKFKQLCVVLMLCILSYSAMLFLTFVLLGNGFPYSGARGYVSTDFMPYQTLEKVRHS